MQKSLRTKILSLALPLALYGVQSQLAQVSEKPSPPQFSVPPRQAQGDPLAQEALAAFVKKDWETAIRDYEKLAKLSPSVADYHLNLGISYYSSGRPHDAIQPLRQALKLKPNLTLARFYLGPSLAGSGQCQEALSHLKKDTSRVSEKHLKYEMGLAGVRCSVALNLQNDIVDFVRLLNRDFPGDTEVLYQTVHVYSDLATRASQELVLKAPTSFFLWLHRISIYRERKNFPSFFRCSGHSSTLTCDGSSRIISSPYCGWSLISPVSSKSFPSKPLG